MIVSDFFKKPFGWHSARRDVRTFTEETIPIRTSDDRDLCYGTLVDLSPGGACVRICRHYAVGTLVKMTLPVTRERSVELKGRVVYVRSDPQADHRRYGIAYFGLDPDAVAGLNAYLFARQRQYRFNNHWVTEESVKPFSRLSLYRPIEGRAASIILLEFAARVA